MTGLLLLALAAVGGSATAEPAGDAAEKKALQVLETHCARCHQQGQLKRLKPARNFGNVLRLSELAREASLVRPGNPDGSRIYTAMVKREMPYDVLQEQAAGEIPTAEEIEAVRDWIGGLKGGTPASCTGRSIIDAAAVAGAIARDLETLPQQQAAAARYVTLTHLANDCGEPAELAAYAMAVRKVLSLVSRGAGTVRIEALGPGRTVLRIGLDDLGWSGADWERLTAAYPYGGMIARDAAAAAALTRVVGTLARITGTATPVVRGDWLASAALRPPLYYDLLKLPASLGALQQQLGADTASAGTVRRVGVRGSLVMRHDRMIERRAVKGGALWTSHDFAGKGPRQSILTAPLGPAPSQGGDQGFVPDGGTSILTLPNGMPGFFLHGSSGERLDVLPPTIVQDKWHRDQPLLAGLGCLGCHGQGVRKTVDDLRAHVAPTAVFDQRTRELIEATHPEPALLSALFEEDLERTRAAFSRAGIDADAKVHGLEIAIALARQHDKPVTLERAAAELGVAPDHLETGLAGAGGELKRLGRRLAQGLAARAEVAARHADLMTHLSGGAAASESERPLILPNAASADGGMVLELWSDKSVYQPGDLVTLTLRTNESCHLTLVSVDTAGKGTVLYPNELEPGNLLLAGRDMELPSEASRYQFRVRSRGTETIIAVCHTHLKNADGIRHDFEKQRFTALGDYRQFLTKAIAGETGNGRNGSDRPRSRGRERSRDKLPERIESGGRPDVQARTAIRLEVR